MNSCIGADGAVIVLTAHLLLLTLQIVGSVDEGALVASWARFARTLPNLVLVLAVGALSLLTLGAEVTHGAELAGRHRRDFTKVACSIDFTVPALGAEHSVRRTVMFTVVVRGARKAVILGFGPRRLAESAWRARMRHMSSRCVTCFRVGTRTVIPSWADRASLTGGAVRGCRREAIVARVTEVGCSLGISEGHSQAGAGQSWWAIHWESRSNFTVVTKWAD